VEGEAAARADGGQDTATATTSPRFGRPGHDGKSGGPTTAVSGTIGPGAADRAADTLGAPVGVGRLAEDGPRRLDAPATDLAGVGVELPGSIVGLQQKKLLWVGFHLHG